MSRPLQVVAELTKRCNLVCRHCGSSCTDHSSDDELSVSEWLSVIEQLVENGTEKIIFSGGEPTLRATELVNIINGFSYYGSNLRYGIVTNGYEMPTKLLEVFDAIKPYAVGVSLDGNEAIHNFIRGKSDSWQKAINTIDALKQIGVQTCAVTTISKWNVNLIAEMAEFLSQKTDSWQIQLASPFGRMQHQTEYLIDEDDFEKLCNKILLARHYYPDLNIEAADCFGVAPAGTIRSSDWMGCTAGLWSMGIDSRGNLTPCLSIQNGIYGGNIRDNTIKQIWDDADCFKLNRDFDCNSVKNGKCREKCDIFDYCRGGCNSLSYSYFGDFHQSPMCYFRTFCQK
jgi:radical SAM protein with 4Fe4S-binding SPASM domain